MPAWSLVLVFVVGLVLVGRPTRPNRPGRSFSHSVGLVGMLFPAGMGLVHGAAALWSLTA